jgi:sugar lactone lactonase YvrE
MTPFPLRLLAAAALLALTGATLTQAAPTRQFAPLKLSQVRGLALDQTGNLYVPDLATSTLYRITPTGETSTVATSPIKHLHAIAVSPHGTLYAVESEVSRVYRLTPTGAQPLVPLERKDVFLGATSIVFDATGNLYIGENDVCLVRKLTPAGDFSIYAGAFKQKGNQDGSATEARFVRPRALAIDRLGNVFVGDEDSHVIRKITPAGVVTTLAGLAGEKGSQDGVGAAARFFSPRGLATDAAGNVYVMDTNNHTVRKITPEGKVTTLAGKAGEPGFADGAGNVARFAGLRAVVVDTKGNLFVSDETNGAVRFITPDGQVSTVAGVMPSL